ncbi:MAG: alkaline phosphatase family protein [Acidobacteriota bacterium]
MADSKRRGLVIGVGLALLAVLVLLATLTHRIGAEQLGLRPDGRRLSPGWHLGSLETLPASGAELTGVSAPRFQEGSEVELRYRLGWQLTGDLSADWEDGLRAEGFETTLAGRLDDALSELASTRSAELATDGSTRLAEALVADWAEPGLRLELRELSLARPLELSERRAEWGRRVLLIGVDGFDWRLADPLLAEGRMPELERLLSEGIRGDLLSADPMLSPLVWTTMVTGRRPEDHGICDFLIVDPSSGVRLPITSQFRQVPALWNVATEAGLSSVFIGWWATWPPEPVLGALVSDRLAYTALSRNVETSLPPLVAHPPALQRRLTALARRGDQVSPELIGRFLQGAKSESKDEDVEHLRTILAGAQSYHAAALELLKDESWELAGVYYEMVDQVCHRFMHLAPPRRADVSAADFAAGSGAVAAAYEVQDELLGELLDAVPRDVVVLLVSDHGFLSGDARPAGRANVAGQPGRWHRRNGVVVARGPDFARGVRFAGGSIEDVGPTVLHLMGLPVGEDMSGRVLLGTDRPVATVPTYDDLVPLVQQRDLTASSELDAAAVEQLSALGYVGPIGTAPPPTDGSDDEGPRGYDTTPNHHLNRGTSLLAAGRFAEAAEEAMKATEKSADYADAWSLLSDALERQGDDHGALEAVRRAAALAPEETELRLRLVRLLAAAGRLDDAERERTRLSEGTRGGSSDAQVARALIALERGQHDEARELLFASLRTDPTQSEALRALLPLADAAGRLGELEELVRRGLATGADLPDHHEALGALALARGDKALALASFQAAVGLRPTEPSLRARWASALMTSGRQAAAREQALIARSQGPKEPESWLLIGSVLGRSGDALVAASCFARARELGMLGPATHALEATAYLQAGQPAKAREILEQGRARHGDAPAFRDVEALFESGG